MKTQTWMKRCSLIVMVLLLLGVAAGAASASKLSVMLYGESYVSTTPAVQVARTEIYSDEARKSASMNFRYNNQGVPVIPGNQLRLDILIRTGAMDERKFRVYRTDEARTLRTDQPLPKNRACNEIGGMEYLGEFQGLAATLRVDTNTWEPGSTVSVAIYVLKKDKYQPFGDGVVSFQVGPRIEDLLAAMKDASDETLKAWGLESYTYEESFQTDVSNKTHLRIHCADGWSATFPVMGRPKPGRYLGFFSDERLEGVVQISRVDGDTVYTESNSGFLRAFGDNPHGLTAAWVVWAEVHSTKGDRQLDAEQLRNLATYPDDGPGTPTNGVRNMAMEMAQSPTGVKHLRQPYSVNSSARVQADYQLWTAEKHTFVVAPQDMWVPEVAVRKVKAIRLASGIPGLTIASTTIERISHPGIANAIGMVLAMAVRHPDRISLANNSKSVANGGAGGSVGPITNNNANTDVNTNTNGNTINVGDGSANGTTTGTGSGTSTAGE